MTFSFYDGAEPSQRVSDGFPALYSPDGNGPVAGGVAGAPEAIGARLRDVSLTLAVAESCTGGLLAAAITSVPGSSGYFLGGVVAYHDLAKVVLLGIPADMIARHGAVSAEVALAMADGARAALGAGIGVGITGIAGPGGGSEEKPVGTVWIAVSSDDVRVPHRLSLPGDREAVRRGAVERALMLILEAAGSRR